jgi:hypothetical protein
MGWQGVRISHFSRQGQKMSLKLALPTLKAVMWVEPIFYDSDLKEERIFLNTSGFSPANMEVVLLPSRLPGGA